MMRKTFAFLFVCLATAAFGGGWKAHYDENTHAPTVNLPQFDANHIGAYQTLFHAPLNTHGVASQTDLPSGFPTPTHVWRASTPLVDLVSGTAFTFGGSPADSDSPFCNDATGFTDVTDHTKCTGTQRFGGAGDYFDADIADYTTDLTACVLGKPTTADVMAFMGRNDAVSGDGWQITSFAGYCYFEIESSLSETGVFADLAAPLTKAWSLCCGVADESGGSDITAWQNGVAGTPSAFPAGAVTSSTNFRIGKSAPVTDFTGDIAMAWIWVGTALSDSQMASFWQHIAGVSEKKNSDAIILQSSAAQNTCWVNGALEEYTKNFPLIGCETPPTLSGGGVPGPYASIVGLVNSNPATVDSWTQNGTAVQQPFAANPSAYRDGRITYKLVDDQAGSQEYVYRTFSVSLSPGDNVVVCLATMSASGTQAIDVIIKEETGASCTPSDHNFASINTGPSAWTQSEFVAPWADGDCTDATIQIGPVSSGGDMGDSSETGSVNTVILGVYLDYTAGQCPNIFSLEPSGSAVSYGDNELSFAVTQPVVDGSGELPDTNRLECTAMWGNGDVTTDHTLLQLDEGAGAQMQRLDVSSSEVFRFQDQDALSISSAAQTITPGTPYLVSGKSNYDTTDAYSLWVQSTLLGTDSTSTMPTTLDELNVGMSTSGAAQSVVGSWIGDVKIRRRGY